MARLFIGGSRHLTGPAGAASVAWLLALAHRQGLQVVTGCASGADACVRSACPGAVVFRVQGPATPQALGARTARAVRFTAASPGSSVAVVFAGSVSPGSLLTCRLAVHHGLPLFVAGLPPAQLPALGGSWGPAPAGFSRFVTAQAALF